MKKKWVIGVDEAGRGPLAGPVAVGLVCVPFDTDLSVLRPRDSKQLKESVREEIFREMKTMRRSGALNFTVSMVSAAVIDRIGITRAVALGISRGIRRFDVDPQHIYVKLDGLLKAPEIYIQQRTIIKGDETEPEISLASIAAKVTRDRYMMRVAKQFPQYQFEIHKGYGTKKHRYAIQRHGLCELHRVSFTRNVQG